MVLGSLQEGCLQGKLGGLAVLSARLRSQAHAPQARKEKNPNSLSQTDPPDHSLKVTQL